MNKLAKALNSDRLIVTAEHVPPRCSDADAIRRFSATLPPNLDAVMVADNPDTVRGSALSAAYLLCKEGHTGVVVSMTTRDRNRIALMSDALGAAALGISGILCVSGEHQSLGVCPQAAGANDLDSTQLIQSLKNMARQKIGSDGSRFDRRPDLRIGGVVHPYLRPMDLNLLRLRKKISAGADFLLTQAVFDLEVFLDWMKAVRAAGYDKRTAIIASVLVFTDAAEARRLQRRGTYGPIPDKVIARIDQASDPSREGVAIATEIAARLKCMPGVRGIHILGGVDRSPAAMVLKQAGIGAGKLLGAA